MKYYEPVLEGLKRLKEDCQSVTCGECIFMLQDDNCLFDTRPENYNLKEIKKRITNLKKLRKQLNDPNK